MKKTTFCAVLVALLGLTAAAGEVYIPSNTPSTGGGPNSWPFETYSAWRYQLRIQSSMLGGKRFRIKEISVAFAATRSPWSATQFQLRMAHTQQTTLSMTFDTNLGAGAVTLIDGPLTFNAIANTWSPLGITSGFDYNGKDHLVLEVRYYRNTTAGASVWTDTGIERCYIHTGNTADPYNATTAITPVPGAMMGMKVRLTTVDTQIIGSGSGRIGTDLTLFLLSPPDGGLAYQVGTSLGTGPIVLGNRLLGLGVDDLLVASVGGKLPGVFQNYAGTLDAQGQATAKMAIPADAALVGIRLHSAFVVLKAGAPFGIESISDTFTFTITK
ncbi:MAG: hypothetical protein JXQ29_13120 [Planctomycetes bacterium]|nr:hypothetical protein [Planctomycetota bacterium]